MKLLFDQNLSPRLADHLADLYPHSMHVQTIGLGRASDEAIWIIARDQNYIIVTKDTDFSEYSLLRGFPPKVIWIRRGNCSSHDIENILRNHHEEIETLHNSEQIGVLTLF